MRGGKRQNSGRKKLWDQEDILARVQRIQDKWWKLVEQYLDSKIKDDQKFAMSEINKLQTKAITQGVAHSGEIKTYVIREDGASSNQPVDAAPEPAQTPQGSESV